MRLLLVWVCNAFLESLFGVFEASWGAFWASRGSLGSLWEPLGEILDRLGAKLSRLGATFGALSFDIFWDRFWVQKGRPEGGILGAQTEQKSIKKRGANLRAKEPPLGVVLV